MRFINLFYILFGPDIRPSFICPVYATTSWAATATLTHTHTDRLHHTREYVLALSGHMKMIRPVHSTCCGVERRLCASNPFVSLPYPRLHHRVRRRSPLLKGLVFNVSRLTHFRVHVVFTACCSSRIHKDWCCGRPGLGHQRDALQRSCFRTDARRVCVCVWCTLDVIGL